jgi:DNA-directed RNA polymerase specialized sigma24 family protein
MPPVTLELLIAFGRLTPLQREALVDHVLIGRTVGEIAESMGCTSQNVSNVLRRARAHLAVMLDVRMAA